MQREGPGLGRPFCVEAVLPVAAWVLYGFSIVLPQAKAVKDDG